jgi:hypothetical protein
VCTVRGHDVLGHGGLFDYRENHIFSRTCVMIFGCIEILIESIGGIYDTYITASRSPCQSLAHISYHPYLSANLVSLP